MNTSITAGAGKRHLLMGNEAIARGAIQAGLELAAAYPGTPSSEVVEALYASKNEFGHYVEWSTNEKVAFEVAMGASLVGARSLVAMKNAGLNVAMDTFMTLPYGGVRGGFLIVVADDPGAHYSSTEQDTRLMAAYAEIPCLEPQDQEEACKMAEAAFAISERLELPVFLRSVTRLSHASGDVTLGPVSDKPGRIGFNKHWKMPYRWNVYGGSGAAKKHEWLHSTFPDQLRESEQSPFNRLTLVNGASVGVIACGIGAAYGHDALSDLGFDGKVNTLKVGFVHPSPENKIRQIIEASDVVLVIEEGDPLVETSVLEIARQVRPQVTVRGKKSMPLFPPTGELNGSLVKQALATVLSISEESHGEDEARNAAREILSPRSSTLCAGCPHLGSYWGIKQALRRHRGTNIVNGDIGCYEQGGYGIFSRGLDVTDDLSKKYGVHSPYEILDTIYVMGSGIGLAQGQANAGYKDGKVLAVAGDSTFFHACLPAVANAVINNSDITFLVFDNSWTAMTGHQPSPRTGRDQAGDEIPALDIAATAKALGMGRVTQANAYDVDDVRDKVAASIDVEGPSMVVIVGECALQVARRLRKAGSVTTVDPEKCTGCKTCLELGCPAIMFDDGSRKASIDRDLCVDCSLCSQVCPMHAISEGGKD